MNVWRTMVSEHYEHIDQQQQKQQHHHQHYHHQQQSQQTIGQNPGANHHNPNKFYGKHPIDTVYSDINDDYRMGSSSSTLQPSPKSSNINQVLRNHVLPPPEQLTSNDTLVQVDVDSLSSPISIKSVNPIKLLNGQATLIPDGDLGKSKLNNNQQNYHQHHHEHPRLVVDRIDTPQQENSTNPIRTIPLQQPHPHHHQNGNSLRSILKNVKAHNGHVTPTDVNTRLSYTSSSQSSSSSSANNNKKQNTSDRSQPKFGILKKQSNFAPDSSTTTSSSSYNATETTLAAQFNDSVLRPTITNKQDPSKTFLHSSIVGNDARNINATRETIVPPQSPPTTTRTTAKKNPFQFFIKDKTSIPNKNVSNNQQNDQNINQTLVRFQMDPDGTLLPSSSPPQPLSSSSSASITGLTIPDNKKIDILQSPDQQQKLSTNGGGGGVPKVPSTATTTKTVPLQLSVNYLQVPSSSASSVPLSVPLPSSSSLPTETLIASKTKSANNIVASSSTTTKPAIQTEPMVSRPKVSGWNRFMLPSKSSNNNQSLKTATGSGSASQNRQPSTISTTTNNNNNQSTRPSVASTNQASYYTGTAGRVSDLRKILNPEVEKEDSFKKFTEAIENCDCFEFNLNNAAKLITIVVLLATFILVVKALKGDR